MFYSLKNAEGGSDLYQVNTPGEEEGILQAAKTPTLVLKCGQVACRSPQVSPDGSFLAFEKTAPTGSGQPNFPQVWLLSLPLGTAPPQNAESPQRLVGDPSHQTNQPAWSSDGQLAYYDTNLAAYVIYDPRSQQMTTLPEPDRAVRRLGPYRTLFYRPRNLLHPGRRPQEDRARYDRQQPPDPVRPPDRPDQRPDPGRRPGRRLLPPMRPMAPAWLWPANRWISRAGPPDASYGSYHRMAAAPAS